MLTEEERAVARRYAVADVVEVPHGRHDPKELFDGEGLLGLPMRTEPGCSPASRRGSFGICVSVVRPWATPRKTPKISARLAIARVGGVGERRG